MFRSPNLPKRFRERRKLPPGSRGESAYRLQPELTALAKYLNIAVKATGQIGYAEDAHPFRGFHEL